MRPATSDVRRHGQTGAVPCTGADERLSPQDVVVRVGTLARSLHDALKELGYQDGIERAAGSMPDTRERLAYVAHLTGQAAERVLDAAERAKAFQASTRQAAAEIEQQWQAALCAEPDAPALQALGWQTQALLGELRTGAAGVDEELTEIVIAQEFHDITCQVIQRISDVAHFVETQLLQLLLDASPLAAQQDAPEGTLAGPVINAAGRDDVVADQQQVDKLLESLGF